MLIGCVIGLVAAYAVSLLAPKIYEARAELWIQGDDPAHQARALGNPLETQLSLLRSEGVFKEAYKAALRKDAAAVRNTQPVKPDLNLYNMYSVVQSPNAAVAMVRVRAYDPDFAAELANQILLTYKITRAKATNSADAAQQQALIQRADQAKQDLDAAENKLQAYKIRTGSPDLNQTTQQTLSYQATLSARLNDAKSEYAQSGIELLSIGKLIKMRPTTVQAEADRAPSAEAQTLQNSLSQLQQQRIDLLKTFTETSSRVKGIDSEIAAVQAQLSAANSKPWQTEHAREVLDPQRQQLQQQFADALTKHSTLKTEIANLTSTLATVQGQVSRLPAAQQDMQRLQRTYDFALTKYNALQQQVSDKVAQALPADAGEVSLTMATPDRTPVSPNVPLLLLLGGGLGLLGGGILSIATRKDMRPVRTSEDLERLTGLSASAVLALPKKKEDRIMKTLPLPGTRPAEAFRFMALTMPGEGAKKVLFTGVGKDAGCSSAAGQFALALACEGRPTLLVDCDFRVSSLTHVFNSEQKPGLSDILRRTLLPSQDNEVSFTTQHENLLFLPSGSSGDGSIADFSHGQLRAAIEMLTERAEIVVLDAPPCDVVTDAVRLCPLVDEVYLVVSAEDTDSAKVSMAHRMLQRCGAKHVHVMLTGGDPSEAPFTAA